MGCCDSLNCWAGSFDWIFGLDLPILYLCVEHTEEAFVDDAFWVCRCVDRIHGGLVFVWG